MGAMNRARRIYAFSLATLVVLASPDIASAQTSANAGVSCERADFKIILDVGHTADSPGAMSARGVPEYEFNLRLAKVIAEKLNDEGYAKTVLLISTGRSKPSMYQRVARINGMAADLLLSIHHDAVPKSFLEKWEYEGKPRFYSDRFKGHSIFVAEGNADRKASLLFGNMLGEQLKARAMDYTPHYTESFMGKFRRTLLDAAAGVYRYDTLWLLKKSRLPAVLLEAGSIVNREEELLLTSTDRQMEIGAAVSDAVDSFCVAQARQHAPQIARSRPKHKKKQIAKTPPAETLAQSNIAQY